MPALNFSVIDKKMMQKMERHIFRRFARHPDELRCDTPFCHAGISMVAIDAKGGIFPCGCAGVGAEMTNYRIGNILDPDSLFDLERLERFHRKPEKYSRICIHCEARFVCEHGCPAFDFQDTHTSESVCKANCLFVRYLKERPEVCEPYRRFLISAGVE